MAAIAGKKRLGMEGSQAAAACIYRLPPTLPGPDRGMFLVALPPVFLVSAALAAALSCLVFFMRSFTSLHPTCGRFIIQAQSEDMQGL